MRKIFCAETIISVETEALIRTFTDKLDVELVMLNIIKQNKVLTKEQIIDKTIDNIEGKLKDIKVQVDYQHKITFGDTQTHFDRIVLEEIYDNLRP